MIWLPCAWTFEGGYQAPDYDQLLGEDVCLGGLSLTHNPILERNLSDMLLLRFRDNFLEDGSRPNKSIAAITATDPGQYHDWRGPVLAYGLKALAIHSYKFKNLDMNDFRHIVDHFLSYCYKGDTNIKGVRINCEGDEKMLNRPKYEAVEVPLRDIIFVKHDSSDIAKRIGLPIFTRQCHPDPQWATNGGSNDCQYPFTNPEATFLHLCCDPESTYNASTGALGWAWAPRKWQNSVGSVVVVRQDKKPLLPIHVEALCKYCHFDIGPLLGHSEGEYYPDEPMARGAVLSMICRPTFSISWYKLLEDKDKQGEDPRDPLPILPPYYT